jgi:small subunit ribosomal protein S7
MRRPIKTKPLATPDFVHQSLPLSKLINYVMESGKKDTAEKIVYGALTDIKNQTKQEPLEVFAKALENAGPTVEVRARRVGGANYQIPHEVRPERRLALALRWIVEGARSKKGKPMRQKLATEIIEASKGEGGAIKKKDTIHKMAEANRAFAHFALRANKK